MTQSIPLSPGDHVVYPRHGAGVIRGLTERTALGQTQTYYDIELRATGMQVLVPVVKAESLGLRRVTPEPEIPDLLSMLGGDDLDLPTSFPPRIRAEQAIVEGGDIREVARLLATLARRQVTRGLADSEGQILRQLRSMLTVEVAVSLNVGEAEAARLIDSHLP